MIQGGFLLPILGAVAAIFYILVIGRASMGWFLRHSERVDLESFPFISVLIPVHNEQDRLRACLTSLEKQNYPRQAFEIIVIDDHSDDNSVELARGFPHVKLIQLMETQGKKQALASGISSAQGELIVSFDADCIIQEGHLRVIAGLYAARGAKLILGGVRMQFASSFASRFGAIDFLSLQAAGAGYALGGNAIMANGANLAFEKEAYHEISNLMGGKVLASGDDMFLLQAMKKKFGKRSIVYASDPDTFVDTDAPSGWSELFQQRLRWVSKGKYYRDGAAVSVALVVATFNGLIVATTVVGLFYPGLLPAALAFYVIKLLSDLPLMRSYAQFTKQNALMRNYIPAAIIYPFYVAGLTIFSILVKPAKKMWRESVVGGLPTK